MTAHRLTSRHGLSLLEVILAIAILGGSLAVIGELMRIGSRNAATARDLLAAQRYCESKLNEVAAGVVDPLAGGTETLDESGEWLCSFSSEPIDDGGLIAVNVVVSQNPDMFPQPISYTLTRWIVDPAVEAAAAAADVQMAAAQKQAAESVNQPEGAVGGASAGGGTGGSGRQWPEQPRWAEWSRRFERARESRPRRSWSRWSRWPGGPGGFQGGPGGPGNNPGGGRGGPGNNPGGGGRGGQGQGQGNFGQNPGGQQPGGGRGR